MRDDVTSLKVQAVQDLAGFATARHPTHPLPLKRILHQESGFSQADHLTTFQDDSMGPKNARLYTL